MQDILRWLFVAAVYGTLVMPVALAILAWRTAPGRRVRRLLSVTGTWVAVCAVAGLARLATNDSYYTPDTVTFWAHSTTGERRAAVVLILATAAASAGVFAFRARGRTAAGTTGLVIGGALGTTVIMLVTTLALGLH